MPLLRGDREVQFDRACTVGPADQRYFSTPAWSLRISPSQHPTESQSGRAAETEREVSRAELFAKPDDWFEINEVSNRCPGIVEKMRSELHNFEAACTADSPASLAPLAEELLFGVN